VNHAVFSPDGQRVVTASNDGTALIWRIVTLDDIARLLASK
jgi:WD40 repeat protein